GSRIAYEGNDGGFYRLDFAPGTPTVQNLETGLITAQYYGMDHDPVDARFAYGGTQDNGTHKFTDPASTVTGVGLVCCGDGAAIRVHPTRNARLFHTACPLDCGDGPFEFLVSDNSGTSSSLQMTGITTS